MSETELQKIPKEVETMISLQRNREKLTQAFFEADMNQSLMISAGATFKLWDEAKQKNFIERFSYEVCSNVDLAPCFDTAIGQRSIVQALRKSLETGLQVGGKHAYLIPQSKVKGGPLEARFSIKAEGYYALLCGGQNPIFRDIQWGKVYEGETCLVDEGTGEVKHSHGITREGKFVGCWVKIIKKNGEKTAVSFDLKKINQWMAVSRAQDYVWKKWPEEMAEQACIRHACTRYADAVDMLAEALEPEPYIQSDDIADRVEGIMPDITPEVKKTTSPQSNNQKKNKKVEEKSNEKESDKFDLF